VQRADQFWERVDRSGDGCWEWLGATNNQRGGYGHVRYQGRSMRAHRLAFELAYGFAPGTEMVLHRCDNPPCCRPEHLFLGTHVDNMRDMRQKGRSAVGDRNGLRVHPESRHFGDRNGLRKHPEKVLRGERNSKAKLSEDQVRMIRKRFLAGESSSKIASELPISPRSVRRIASGERWAHVK